jgi:hypothetical protein
MRIIAAAVVLGIGMAGIALAQVNGQEPKRQSSEWAKLRAQVVKLQVEIELLQLEHDADRTVLLDLLQTARKNDLIPVALAIHGRVDVRDSNTAPKTAEEWNALETRAMMGDEKAHEMYMKVSEAVEKAEKKGEDVQEAMLAAWKELSDQRAKKGDPLQNHIDRKKKEFSRQAAELAEKRLELADVEKRLNEAK